jgi:hypothetical protein
VIVLDNPEKSSLNSIQEISHHYQVDKVWMPKNQASLTVSKKMVQMFGFEKRTWQGIKRKTRSIPGQDLIVYLEISNLILVFANKGEANFWDSLPDHRSIDTLVGLSLGRLG